MNEPFRPLSLPPKPGTTQAADGLPRRRWSVADLEKMLEAGIWHEDDRFELIGGDVVAMAAKGRRHELLRTELNMYWARRCPDSLKIAPETPLRLGDNDEPEPDFIVYPATILAPDVRGDTVLLVVEIADSSLGYDRNFKAPRYARFGVGEYWVMNANNLVTTVHRQPASGAYAFREDVAPEQLLTPEAAPALATRLADLDLG